MSKGLGSVYLSWLFLQGMVDLLYKAELVSSSYSTPTSDNAVERVNKPCPRAHLNGFIAVLRAFYLTH